MSSEMPQTTRADGSATLIPTGSARRVPELSLRSYSEGTAEQKAQFSRELYTGFLEYGFVILKDHPVQAALLQKCYSLLEKFFALPTEAKRKYISKQGGGQRGYTPFGEEHAKDSPVMDLKEFWHVGRELTPGHEMSGIYPENIWPTEIPEFKPTFLEVFEKLEKAGDVMLEALTGPLQLPAPFFDKMVHNGNSILRLLHYPPIPEGVDPRCIRAAAHEDINFITLLPAATTSGLQLRDRDGQWLDVGGDPGDLIVDSGDMLSRLTNEVIPSTTHRVINPANSANVSRYSMPFFMHPRSEVLLQCLPSCRGAGEKFADITAGDFLMQRLREIGLIK